MPKPHLDRVVDVLRLFAPGARCQQEHSLPRDARRIVEGHGGWIHLDSHSGEGAQFTVHLPHDTDDDS